ncbi:MAG: hypothetical protein NC543_15395 [bacterium]|nr:hypothetical protein [bacterium]MCM1376673.1 hypothetical protein [Muribaculum sp.]
MSIILNGAGWNCELAMGLAMTLKVCLVNKDSEVFDKGKLPYGRMKFVRRQFHFKVLLLPEQRRSLDIWIG